MENHDAPTAGAAENARDEREDVRRLSAFSDGVIAIAMTLLVLDLAKPQLDSIHSAADLHAALAQWSAYASFALSFGVMSLYWFAHFRTFRTLKRVDMPVLVLNICFLFGITFIPFPTAILQRFTDYRVAVMLYAGTLAAVGFIWAALWIHADRAGLLDKGRDRSEVLFDILQSPVIFLVSMAIAWFSPSWATRSWFMIAIPSRIFAAIVHRRRA